MHRSLFASLSIAALVMAGCDGDPPADADAGPVDAATGDADTTDSGSDAGAPDNDSFETATTIAIDAEESAADEINPRMDVDYFRFDGTAGQWVAIFTSSTMPDAGNRVDTVITLYDASMTQIAENDDALPRADVDSEVILKLPATGTYYVRVQEFSTWAPEMVEDGPQGGPSYDYTLVVITLDEENPRVRIDPETGDDAASAVTAAVTGNVGFLLGDFDAPGDVDVFRFNTAGRATLPQSLFVAVMPTGPMGYGATGTIARVWVTDDAGTTIFARGEVGPDAPEFQPTFLTAGPQLLWVEAPAGAAGANDHYVIKLLFRGDNPPEGAADNDTLATAAMLRLNPIMDATGENGFVLAQLAEGDVDYYGFDVMAGRTLSIACGSRNSGSGVLDLTAELRDESDAVLAMDGETATENAFIDAFAVPGAGRYYLRISSSGQDPEVTGAWVRCGVTAAPPAATP